MVCMGYVSEVVIGLFFVEILRLKLGWKHRYIKIRLYQVVILSSLNDV